MSMCTKQEEPSTSSVEKNETKEFPQQSMSEVRVTMPKPIKLDLEKHLLQSCVMMWCCNILFGGIAYLIVRGAKNQSYERARHRIKVAFVLNIVGMLVTWLIIAIILALYFTHNFGDFLPYYRTD